MNINVEIYRNKFVLHTDAKSVTVSSANGFSTERLLVGQFTEATRCLSEGLKALGITGFFKMNNLTLIMIPKEMTDGGLSQVEGRTLRELAMDVGASTVELVAFERD